MKEYNSNLLQKINKYKSLALIPSSSADGGPTVLPSSPSVDVPLNADHDCNFLFFNINNINNRNNNEKNNILLLIVIKNNWLIIMKVVKKGEEEDYFEDSDTDSNEETEDTLLIDQIRFNRSFEMNENGFFSDNEDDNEEEEEDEEDEEDENELFSLFTGQFHPRANDISTPANIIGTKRKRFPISPDQILPSSPAINGAGMNNINDDIGQSNTNAGLLSPSHSSITSPQPRKKKKTSNSEKSMESFPSSPSFTPISGNNGAIDNFSLDKIKERPEKVNKSGENSQSLAWGLFATIRNIFILSNAQREASFEYLLNELHLTENPNLPDLSEAIQSDLQTHLLITAYSYIHKEFSTTQNNEDDNVIDGGGDDHHHPTNEYLTYFFQIPYNDYTNYYSLSKFLKMALYFLEYPPSLTNNNPPPTPTKAPTPPTTPTPSLIPPNTNIINNNFSFASPPSLIDSPKLNEFSSISFQTSSPFTKPSLISPPTTPALPSASPAANRKKTKKVATSTGESTPVQPITMNFNTASQIPSLIAPTNNNNNTSNNQTNNTNVNNVTITPNRKAPAPKRKKGSDITVVSTDPVGLNVSPNSSMITSSSTSTVHYHGKQFIKYSPTNCLYQWVGDIEEDQIQNELQSLEILFYFALTRRHLSYVSTSNCQLQLTCGAKLQKVCLLFYLCIYYYFYYYY